MRSPITFLSYLHEKAEIFARQLGCGDYDTQLAEQDFRNYLTSEVCGTDPDYPPWGARSSWQRHTQNITSQSGTGNPFSPLIVVGSELSADATNYQELYFKLCFDLLWKELFEIPGLEFIRHRIRKSFIKHWGGAGEEDKNSGYEWAPFYKSLRDELISDKSFYFNHPFVGRHMVWHSNGNRGEGQQWGKISKLTQLLIDWPVFPPEWKTLIDCKENSLPFDKSDASRNTIDDLAFFTEYNLEAAQAGQGGDTKNKNEFIFQYAFPYYRQPRIFLFNPRSSFQDDSRDEIKADCQLLIEWRSPEKKHTRPICLWRHKLGHYIVFSPINLTSGGSDNLLADIARLIRKAARRL